MKSIPIQYEDYKPPAGPWGDYRKFRAGWFGIKVDYFSTKNYRCFRRWINRNCEKGTSYLSRPNDGDCAVVWFADSAKLKEFKAFLDKLSTKRTIVFRYHQRDGRLAVLERFPQYGIVFHHEGWIAMEDAPPSDVAMIKLMVS